MGAWLSDRSFVELLGVVSAYFVGLTLLSLAAGYGAQRTLQKQGKTVFDVPLKRRQTRHELIGNVLFHLMFLPAAAAAVAFDVVRFREGLGVELLTFAASVYGFQAYYWFLHRAMHWRPLFFMHRWHHDSLVTTPLTGFSMHPLETVGWIVGFLAPAALFTLFGGAGFWGTFAFLTVAWYGNIVGHANAEMMPAITSSKWGSRLFSNPITYHCLHHARFDNHYGFATAWMDAIFGTQWPDWIAVSERVRGGEPMTKLRERLDVEAAAPK